MLTKKEKKIKTTKVTLKQDMKTWIEGYVCEEEARLENNSLYEPKPFTKNDYLETVFNSYADAHVNHMGLWYTNNDGDKFHVTDFNKSNYTYKYTPETGSWELVEEEK